MKIITVINGEERMVLQPENELEEQLVKRLDGATCKLISNSNPVSILENNVSGGLLLSKSALLKRIEGDKTESKVK